MSKKLSLIFENKKFPTLNVSNYGHEKCLPYHSFSYAYPNFYIIHYVENGSGRFYCNGVCRHVEKGHIFIIRPGNVYYYEADQHDPWEYRWIHIDGTLATCLDTLDDVVELKSNIFLEMEHAAKLESTCAEFLTGKAYELFSQLFENTTSHGNYVTMTAEYIKSNYTRKISVEEIAFSLNINRRYLSRIFKKEYGVPIQTYIIEYKLKKACEFLKKGFNVNEVARLCGYEDSFTFSKIFKKHMNVSPSHYRS